MIELRSCTLLAEEVGEKGPDQFEVTVSLTPRFSEVTQRAALRVKPFQRFLESREVLKKFGENSSTDHLRFCFVHTQV